MNIRLSWQVAAMLILTGVALGQLPSGEFQASDVARPPTPRSRQEITFAHVGRDLAFSFLQPPGYDAVHIRWSNPSHPEVQEEYLVGLMSVDVIRTYTIHHVLPNNLYVFKVQAVKKGGFLEKDAVLPWVTRELTVGGETKSRSPSPAPPPAPPPPPAAPQYSDVSPGYRLGSLTMGGSAPPPKNAPLPAPPPPPANAPCSQGYVWRDAFPGDNVCVTPQSRNLASAENSALGHAEPCRPGTVWREARPSDHVCVTLARRAAIADENRLASGHIAKPPVACSGFLIQGKWEAIQSNGYGVQFNLQQTGSRLHGTASFPVHLDGGLLLVKPMDYTIAGVADGVVNNRAFSLNVYWDSSAAGNPAGSIGIYQGTVGQDGHINGSTHDKLSPSDVATWYSKEGFNCH